MADPTNNPLNICVLSADSPYNVGSADGFQTYIANLCDALKNEGHHVLVYAFSRKVKKVKQVKINQVEYWCLPDMGYSQFKKMVLLSKFLLDFRKIHAKYKIDVICGQGGYCWPLIFIKKPKRIATIHGGEPFWQTPTIEKFFRVIMGKIIYPRFDGIIFICHAIEQIAKKYYPKITRVPSQTIYPPIPAQNLTVKKCSGIEYSLIAAGRSAQIKNFASLIKGFEIAKQKWPNLSLSIFGPGQSKNDLGDYGKGFLPHVKLIEKISETDIVIVPSLNEVMPNIALEAMAQGKVCIIGQWETSSEIIQDSADGYIIKTPPNSTNISNSIKKALKDRNNWPEISKSAYIKITNKFSPEKIVHEMVEFIHRIRPV